MFGFLDFVRPLRLLVSNLVCLSNVMFRFLNLLIYLSHFHSLLWICKFFHFPVVFLVRICTPWRVVSCFEKRDITVPPYMIMVPVQFVTVCTISFLSSFCLVAYLPLYAIIRISASGGLFFLLFWLLGYFRYISFFLFDQFVRQFFVGI